MSRTSTITRLSNSILSSPILWGGLACLGFYAVLGQSTLNYPLVGRYFESHPVEYITTALFFIGLASLVTKTLDVVIQSMGLDSPLLESIPDGGQPTDDAADLVVQLDRRPAALKRGYMVRRLREALEFVRRKGTADSLDGQLRFLADEDFGRMHASYAFVRIVIWSIPILGFLGTVIGITLAIGKLTPQQLEESLTAVMSGLSVAFDTTALALSLSIILMFAKFFVEQLESGLLSRVDARVNEALVGRFQSHGAANDPNVALIRRSSETMIAATEKLTQRQAEIWQETIDEAHSRWMSLTTAAGEVVEAALAEAISGSIERHATVLESGLEHHATELLEGMARQSALLTDNAEKQTTILDDRAEKQSTLLAESASKQATVLAETTTKHADAISQGTKQLADLLCESLAEHTRALTTGLEQHREAITVSEQSLAEENRALSEENRKHLAEVQRAIVETAAQAVLQQEQLVKQGDVLLKVVDATGQVQRLEETLNHNLAALAGSHNFGQTVTSLAAAIQLLSIQLDPVGPGLVTVQLDDVDSQPPAAA